MGSLVEFDRKMALVWVSDSVIYAQRISTDGRVDGSKNATYLEFDTLIDEGSI